MKSELRRTEIRELSASEGCILTRARTPATVFSFWAAG